MEIIQKYFPNISVGQQQQFAALDALYRDWKRFPWHSIGHSLS